MGATWRAVTLVLQQDIDFQAFSRRHAAGSIVPDPFSATLCHAMDEHIFGPALVYVRSFYTNRWVKSRTAVSQFAHINAGYIPGVDFNAMAGKTGDTFCAGIFQALAIYSYEIACFVAYHFDLTTWEPREISRPYRLFDDRIGTASSEPAELEIVLAGLLHEDFLTAVQRGAADRLCSAMLRFVWTHEVQHILCGHVDYMRAQFSLAALPEILVAVSSDCAMDLGAALLLRTEFEMTADILAAFQVLSDEGEIRDPVFFTAHHEDRALFLLAIILVMYAWLQHDIRRLPGYFTPVASVGLDQVTQPPSQLIPGRFALPLGSHPPTPIRYHNILRILSLLAAGRLDLTPGMKVDIDRDSVNQDLHRAFRCMGHLSQHHESFRLMLHSRLFAKATAEFFDQFGGEDGARYLQTVREAREIHATYGHELDRGVPSVRPDYKLGWSR